DEHVVGAAMLSLGDERARQLEVRRATQVTADHRPERHRDDRHDRDRSPRPSHPAEHEPHAPTSTTPRVPPALRIALHRSLEASPRDGASTTIGPEAFGERAEGRTSAFTELVHHRSPSAPRAATISSKRARARRSLEYTVLTLTHVIAATSGAV